MKNKSVLEAKRLGITTCEGDDDLYHAAQMMVEEDISCLVVVNKERNLDGIITRTDILAAFNTAENWKEKKVNEYMSKEVLTAITDDSLEQVANILLDNKVHRLVVVQVKAGKKRPVAVISEADLVYHLVTGDV